eukprot:1746638-Prymnesium_polylepis.2
MASCAAGRRVLTPAESSSPEPASSPSPPTPPSPPALATPRAPLAAVVSLASAPKPAGRVATPAPDAPSASQLKLRIGWRSHPLKSHRNRPPAHTAADSSRGGGATGTRSKHSSSARTLSTDGKSSYARSPVPSM